MRKYIVLNIPAILMLLLAFPSQANLVYWNVFNIEDETSVSADLVTYSTLADMLANTNRTSTNIVGGFGRNIVGSGSDGNSFWNVFNIEEETSVAADLVTYSTLADMLANTNRTSTNTVGSFGRNIVGSGSDGNTYWNVFNIEDETSVSADIVTYDTLADMLANTNRTSTNIMDGFGRNIVGSGSDGTTFWNVFNIENETSVSADLVTYSSLADMLANTNRTSTNIVGGFGRNIVGSGAYIMNNGPPNQSVPEPTTIILFALGTLGLISRKIVCPAN